MNINPSASIYADFLRESAVKNADRERDKYLRENEQPNNSTVQATEDSAGYSVEISGERMRKTGEADNELNKMTDEHQIHMKQLEDAREQGEAVAESWKTRIKCLQIAMRIISGDEVPREDHQYLAKHDPELYSEAVSRRMPKEDPRKHERLSEDEKSETSDMTADLPHIESLRFENNIIV